MATEAGGDLRCGIGARLRGARERSGMSILQAAEKLHADPRVLEALEAERFDELGAAVFVRGHIRRYAELVRENSQELQDLYAASSHAVARPDLTRIPTTHGSRSTDPRRLLVPGLAFVIVVGAVGLAWWFFKDLQIPGGLLAKSDEPATVTAEPAPLADETPTADLPSTDTSSADALSPDMPQPDTRTADVPPASTPVSPSRSSGGTTGAGKASDTTSGQVSGTPGAQSSAARTGAAPSAPTSGATGTTSSAARTAAVTTPAPAVGTTGTTPSAPARAANNTTPSVASKPAVPAAVQPRSDVPTSSRSAAVQTPPPPAAADVASPVAAASPPASAPAGTPNGKIMEFTLRFSGDSWAEVYDAKGAKLFYDVGSADSVKTMSGSPPLRVILGNPNGVAVEVNGKSATVPKMKGDNGVQFTVFRNGRLSRGRAAPSGQ